MLNCNKSNIIHVSSTSKCSSTSPPSLGELDVVGTGCLDLDNEPTINVQQEIDIVYTVCFNHSSTVSQCSTTRYLYLDL